jgi:hypothetical protein
LQIITKEKTKKRSKNTSLNLSYTGGREINGENQVNKQINQRYVKALSVALEEINYES